MLTPDKYAYRAGPELAAALDVLRAQAEAFVDDVVTPWERTQTDVESVWYPRITGGMECLGFRLKKGVDKPPKGLVGGRDGNPLRPRNTKSGDPWRAQLRVFDGYPRSEIPLRDHGVEPLIMRRDLGRHFRPGMLRGSTGEWFLTWGCEHPNPGPHLTAAPLSEFYAAAEAVKAFAPNSGSSDG